MNPYFCYQIDWNDNGSFVDANEDLSLLIRNSAGVASYRGNSLILDLNPPAAGSFTATVDNSDKKFSSEYISSPLYGKLNPGHQMRLKLNSLTMVWNRTGINGYVYTSLNSAPASYTIVAGDVLYYDIKWSTSTDFSAFDLRDAAGFQLEGKGAKDQNGLSADAVTDISAYCTDQFYSRIISMPSSVVGKVFTNFMAVSHGSANITYTSEYQNIFIKSISGTLTSIFQSPESINFADQIVFNGSTNRATLSTSYLWNGYLDNIQQNPKVGQFSATLPALGLLSKFVGNLVTTQLYSNITTDVALGYICDALGIVAGFRNFQTGNTTLDWWWLNNEDAFQAAITLTASEGPGAKLYENGQGKLRFENRQFRYTNTASTTSQYTFLNTGSKFQPSYNNYTYDPGLKNITNVAVATQNTRTVAGSLTTVWSYPSGTVTLAANQVWQVIANFADPVNSAVVPVVVNDFTLVSGTVTPTIDKTSGQNITITMTTGVSGCSFSGLSIRDKLVSIANTILITNTLNTSASQTTYGVKSYTIPLRAEIPINTMQDLVNGIVSIYQNPRVTLTINTQDKYGSTGFNAQKFLEISQRITVTEPQSAFNGDVWIENVGHTIKAGGNFQTNYGVEKVIATAYSTWDSAIWDHSVWGF